MKTPPTVPTLETDIPASRDGAAAAARPATGPLAWLERALPRPALPGPRALTDDARAAVVLWSAAVILILMVFRAGFADPGDLYSGWSSVERDGLGWNLYWVSWGVLLYLFVPLAVVLLVFRESPARYGLRVYVTKRTALLYLAMIAAMLPLLFWASGRGDFQRTYPFVKDLGAHTALTILVWECAQVARFVCLEFFFRGYLIFGMEGKLGYTAIAASTVPYALIHYAKPFPEAMAAIVAGAVLGFVALRTRTIIGGAIIHSTVAVSMDLLALWRTDVIF